MAESICYALMCKETWFVALVVAAWTTDLWRHVGWMRRVKDGIVRKLRRVAFTGQVTTSRRAERRNCR